MSNLPPPLRSRFSHGPSAASGGHPLVPSSAVVPAPIAVMSHSLDGADSLAPIPSHGHSVNEDAVPPVESLELAPQMDKGKQP